MKTSIIILARDCDSTNIVYNYLKNFFQIAAVVYENPIPRKEQFMRRVKLLGFFPAAGQVAFMLLVYPVIKFFSQKRKKEIYALYGLNENPIPSQLVMRIKKINSDEGRSVLQQLKADLIIVNGTRIISEKTLKAVASIFINIHTGITPLFRGVYGGYWAVARKRKKFFGATIHYVDAGIDTGSVIAQVFTSPGKRDNIYTYPYLQYAVCMPALKDTVQHFCTSGKAPVSEPATTESALWFHPTLWQWLANLGRTFVLGFLYSAI
jgi:folate-dependent phosphoribosylglycinamide formyltransferase PurN